MTGKTWRPALALRIGIGILAAFMFSTAAMMVGVTFDGFRGAPSADLIVFVSAILVIVGFGIFTTFALVAVARTRVSLAADRLDAMVVAGHNRLLVPQFRSVQLPFRDIGAVETRCEIFRTLGMSTERVALSLVTTSGQRIGLFSNTLGSFETLPFDQVANAIAAAAGISVTDVGTVRTRGSGAGLYGAASSSWTESPLDARSANKAQRAVALTLQICTGLILLTFLLRAFL